uniref:FAS1 domain-containing protein n=1 Tax=Kalanchoe fedtschenkoi TaxID=63787 RepID=A0A7N0UKU9_KALFE
MASQHRLSLLLFLAASFLLSSPSLAQTPSAPSSGLPNVTGILDKAGQYTTLIRLLGNNQLATQLENQLNTSSEGLTLLAPTDNAFNNLPAGTLNGLSNQQQVELILYHVLPKYYSFLDFSTVSNPVRTQGQDGLNFTSQANQLNVSSGLVTAPINNPLRQQFPLAVYQVDKVLLPLSLFGAKPPAPAASTGSNKNKTEAQGPTATSDKNDNSGSGRMNVDVGMGLVAGLILVSCMGAFSS